MSCDHSIELKNFNENIKYSREIILIIGTVKNPCDEQLITCYLNDTKNLQQTVFNGQFKIILRLEKNTWNEVKIKYCSNEVVVKIQHQSIDPVSYDIQPLYIIPKNHDGKFESDDCQDNSVASAIDKINLITELSQCVYSSKLYETFKEEKSFDLKKCDVLHSNLDVEDVWNMNQWDLYDKIAQELIDKFGADVGKKRKFVGFVSCTKFLGLSLDEDYNYVNIKNKTIANPSLGNGFLALLGNGCFYALPNHISQVVEAFQNKTAVDVTKLLDDSNYRKNFGGCFSTFLGSLIHEMGHIFDLGHTINGLMGNDIDYVHRLFLCQNFTEIMPKRNISNCQQTKKVECATNNRVTKIKKNGFYLEKYHEQKNNDMTYFELNCGITLFNHKWFTQNSSADVINYDELGRIVRSQNSNILIVEIRETEAKGSILRKFWDIRDDHVKEFNIPNDMKLENVTIFAINGNGCLLRKYLFKKA